MERRQRWQGGVGSLLVALCLACGGSAANGAETQQPSNADGTDESEPPPRPRGPAAASLAPSGQASTAPAGGHGGGGLRRVDSGPSSRLPGAPPPENTEPSPAAATTEATTTPGPTASARQPAPRGHAVMRLAAPEPVGAQDGEFEIGRVSSRVRTAVDDLTRCYERELSRDATLAGSIHIDFTIQVDGAVSDVSAAANTVSPEVATCVIGIVSTFRFAPGPTGGPVRIRAPFQFFVES
jgi:hypothetical protein